MKKIFLVFLLVGLTISVAVNAQQPVAQSYSTPQKPAAAQSSPLSADQHQLESKLMQRKMPYFVVLPTGYKGNQTKRFSVVYLLHGLTGSYKDWIEKTNLLEYAAEHDFIIVTIEGGNGWYTDSASKTNDKYESYIVQELIPEIDKNYRTIAERGGRAIAGLSMGGYGAIKFGLKYPDKFVFAASMSGAVNIASWKTSEQIPPVFRDMIISTFGDENNPVKKANDLFVVFSEIPAEKISGLPFFYLDCGTEDELGLLQFNQKLAGIFQQRKIPHEFRELPGKHNWNLWGQQIGDVLRISERIFNSQTSGKTAMAK